jgi:hypothetical protein
MVKDNFREHSTTTLFKYQWAVLHFLAQLLQYLLDVKLYKMRFTSKCFALKYYKKIYIFSQIRFVKLFCQHHGITGITVLERIY